jgi:hypothetical protein
MTITFQLCLRIWFINIAVSSSDHIKLNGSMIGKAIKVAMALFKALS